MPAMRLSRACLEAPDRGALVRGVHLCGGGFAGGEQVGVPQDTQLSGGLSCVGSSGRAGWRSALSG